MIQQTTTHAAISFPNTYSNPQVNEFLQTYLQDHYSDAKAKLFVWKKHGNTYQQLAQQKLSLPITFSFFTPGHYIISSNDLIKPFIIDIYITPNKISTQLYYNCVVHH